MNFVAIDFETANEKKHSICSMGIAVIENGKIVDSKNWLIKPPEIRFNKINANIHKITEEDIIDKPEFYQLWPEIKTYLEGNIVLAHNAGFDLYALRDILDYYNLDHPDIKYCCTVQIAQKTWNYLPNHKLKTIVEHFGINTKRHEAEADAITCANIALRSSQENGSDSIEKLTKSLRLRLKNFPKTDSYSNYSKQNNDDYTIRVAEYSDEDDAKVESSKAIKTLDKISLVASLLANLGKLIFYGFLLIIIIVLLVTCLR
ncbi:MAG: 3'-5' exonuclease [Actinomycetia bacterium]|nr:3'-5' exonuclease [Actinomycetes bacterium]